MTKNANGQGSFYKRKDGKFEYKVTVKIGNSQLKRKSFYGKTKKECMQKYKLFKERNVIHESQFNDVYIDEYINSWLNTVKKNDLKPTSFDRLEITINSHVIPKIGHYYLNRITTLEIQSELINKMDKQGLSYSTIKKAKDAINACFNYAIGEGRISFNPCINLKLPVKKKQRIKQIAPLNNIEIEQLKQACLDKYNNGSYKYKYGVAYILILNTGLREGEALGLQWNDINFNEKYLTVSRQVQEIKDRKLLKVKPVISKYLKSNSSNRIIPLNDTAINCLEIMRKGNKSKYVILNKENNFVSPHSFRMSFNKIIEYSNIERSNITVHTLRHTFATNLFANDINIKYISNILGHSDINITSKTYIHIIENMKQKELSNIPDL